MTNSLLSWGIHASWQGLSKMKKLQNVHAQVWEHGLTSHLQKGHEQCEYCFCISTWPVTGLHHCYGRWKIQSEAVWVSCMIKMFFTESSTLLSGQHLVDSTSLWSTCIRLRCYLWVNQLQTSASPLPFTIGGIYLVVCPIWSSWHATHRNLARLVELLLWPSCTILHTGPSWAIGSCGRHWIFRRIRTLTFSTVSTANIGLLMPCCLVYSAILISILLFSTVPWRHTWLPSHSSSVYTNHRTTEVNALGHYQVKSD